MSDSQLTDIYDEEELAQIKAAYRSAVYHARNALFFSAGVLLLPIVIFYSRYDQISATWYLILFVIMFCTFIGLALWTQRKPYTALLIGALAFCLYSFIGTIPFISLYGIEGFFKGLYVGCLFKIIILSLIGKASPKAKQMQKMVEDLKIVN